MPALPLDGERCKAVFAIGRQRTRKLGSQAREQAVTVDRGRSASGNRGKITHRLRDVPLDRQGQAYVETDADDDRRRTQRVAVQFDEDSADLQMAVNEIVRPLELDAGEPFGFQCVDDRNADRQRKSSHEAGALLEAPAE